MRNIPYYLRLRENYYIRDTTNDEVRKLKTILSSLVPEHSVMLSSTYIVAKKMPADKDGVRIAELDEMSYRRQLWEHTPLTDFWRVGRGIKEGGSIRQTQGKVKKIDMTDGIITLADKQTVKLDCVLGIDSIRFDDIE